MLPGIIWGSIGATFGCDTGCIQPPRGWLRAQPKPRGRNVSSPYQQLSAVLKAIDFNEVFILIAKPAAVGVIRGQPDVGVWSWLLGTILLKLKGPLESPCKHTWLFPLTTFARAFIGPPFFPRLILQWMVTWFIAPVSLRRIESHIYLGNWKVLSALQG
jgi:hypothetical protein